MELHLVNLLAILVVAWLAGAIATRVGYPSILGELAAGIVFGPAVLGLLQPSKELALLAELGVFLMMLYIGIELDHRELFAASWAGLLTAVGGFITPAILGYLAMRWATHFSRQEAIFTAVTLGVTPLVVNSRILMEMKLLGTRLGTVLVASAFISDTLGIVLFAGMISLMKSHVLTLGAVGSLTFKAVLFFGITISLGLFVFPFVGRRLVQAGFKERTTNFTLVLLVSFTFAVMAEQAGLHAILGAFIAGLFLREEVLMRKLSHEIATLVHDVSIGFLAPIFFVTAGFHVSLGVIHTHLPLLLLITAANMVGKTLGGMLFYLPTRRGWREGLVIGAGMNGHGTVEIIFAELAHEVGYISQPVFSVLILVIFLTTSGVPLLLKWGTRWLRRSGDLVRMDQKRQGTVIVGAGPLARMMARELAGPEPIRLVDTSREDIALAQSEGLAAIHGNALREETLSVAQAGRARSFIALTSNDEVNRFAADAARTAFGIPEVHVLKSLASGDTPAAPFGPSSLSQEVPIFGGPISIDDWNRWIARREVERVTFGITRAAPPGQIFSDINEESEMLPLLINREGVRTLFHTASEIQVTDEVVALRHKGEHDPLDARMQEILKSCPIMDLEESPTAELFFEQAAEIMSSRINIPGPQLAAMLANRERESSTVMLPGIAIPHIIVEGERVLDMLVARSRAGIRFSPTGSPVRAVFLLIGSRDERNFHLRALSTIGSFFQDANFEEKWLAVNTPEDLRQLLIRLQKRRTKTFAHQRA